VDNIQEVVDFFQDELLIERTIVDTKEEFDRQANLYDIDFADVRGQET